jgi:quercetin dioxygenase-like cupin family protein
MSERLEALAVLVQSARCSEKSVVLDLDAEAKGNDHYRHVLYTNAALQVVLYALMPGEDIPEEVHAGGTQIIGGVKGHGEVVVAGVTHKVKKGLSVVIPPGAAHYVRNASGAKSFKFSSIYAPPEFPGGHMDVRQPKP